MEEIFDEWRAVELILGLTEIYSDLGPVWLVEEQTEEGYSLTVGDFGERLLELNKIAPKPFDTKLKQIYDNLNTIYLGYEKTEKLVPKDSDIGTEIFSLLEEICDYLKNSWKKLYKMEKRVLAVFPPLHFDFRFQISNLNKEYFHYSILDSLKEAISFFNKKEYANCINSCGQASEKLTETLVDFRGLEVGKNWRSNLDRLLKNNRKSTVSLIDLHCFICYLLDVVYFLRNPHSTRAVDIPEWMDNYKKHMMQSKPRWARIALICSLEAAETFQKIREHS